MLGSGGSGRSFLVDYGHRWPNKPQHRLATCSARGATAAKHCTVSTGLLQEGANANVLRGQEL
jgi:hypothetical protein